MASIDSAPTRLFDSHRLFAGMDDAALDGVVAHSHRNFYYLSGFPSLDYVIDPEAANYVLIPRDPAKEAVVTIPASERLQLQTNPIWVPEKIVCGKFYIMNGPVVEGEVASSTWEGLVHALDSNGLAEGRVGFELEFLPYNTYKRLKERFPKLQIVDAGPLFRWLRLIKTDEEIRRIRIACEITEQAIDEAARSLRLGMTEKEFADCIAAEICTRGAEVLYVQVATGQVAGLGQPTDRPITKGDILRIDVAATYKGYNSDLGRCFVVGTPTPEQKRFYQVAYQALQTGIAAVQIGQTSESIFDAAMSVWTEAGYTAVQRHHVGHGIGLQAHEAPMLKPGNKEPIASGMVLAVEVPCYVYNLGGFAPEDILVVEGNTKTQFTQAPAELPVLG